LRNRNLKYKFRRQHPIGFFSIDSYCAEAKLLIEIDGESHVQHGQSENDQARTEYMESLGYRVSCFTNNEVRYNIDAVIAEIVEQVETRINELKRGY
jgi:very-short-patch-repair endonuclease